MKEIGYLSITNTIYLCFVNHVDVDRAQRTERSTIHRKYELWMGSPVHWWDPSALHIIVTKAYTNFLTHVSSDKLYGGFAVEAIV